MQDRGSGSSNAISPLELDVPPCKAVLQQQQNVPCASPQYSMCVMGILLHCLRDPKRLSVSSGLLWASQELLKATEIPHASPLCQLQSIPISYNKAGVGIPQSRCWAVPKGKERPKLSSSASQNTNSMVSVLVAHSDRHSVPPTFSSLPAPMEAGAGWGCASEVRQPCPALSAQPK